MYFQVPPVVGSPLAYLIAMCLASQLTLLKRIRQEISGSKENNETDIYVVQVNLLHQ